MGNCMEAYSKEQQQVEESTIQEEVQKSGRFVEEVGFGRSGLTVKIVLPKEELEWLMGQLDDLKGKRLEDVLRELKKGMMRVKVEEEHVNKVWKPSLESIMEIPEIHGEMDR